METDRPDTSEPAAPPDGDERRDDLEAPAEPPSADPSLPEGAPGMPPPPPD